VRLSVSSEDGRRKIRSQESVIRDQASDFSAYGRSAGGGRLLTFRPLTLRKTEDGSPRTAFRAPVAMLLNGSSRGRGGSLTTQQPNNSSTCSASAKPNDTSHGSHFTTHNQEITAAVADVISFWPTNNPAYGISWRYRLGLLNHVGEKSWKGREVRLRH
jgi:hypothetical protein